MEADNLVDGRVNAVVADALVSKDTRASAATELMDMC